MVCPNKNLPEWKQLVESVGEFEAYRDFFEYGGLIRTPEQVKLKLNLDNEGQLLEKPLEVELLQETPIDTTPGKPSPYTIMDVWDKGGNIIGKTKVVTLTMSEYNRYKDVLLKDPSVSITLIEGGAKIVIPMSSVVNRSKQQFLESKYAVTSYTHTFRRSDIPREGSVKTLIETILPELPDVYRNLWDKLKDVSSFPAYELRTEAQLYDHVRQVGTYGRYFPDTNKIELIENFAPKVLMHELLHALTYTHISGTGTWRNFFNEVKAHLKNHGVEYKPGSALLYGLKDEHEFMSELFTNFAFIKLLDEIPAMDNRSLLTKIWEFILETLGKFTELSKPPTYDHLVEKNIIQYRDSETLQKCK
jgi:hypothetical protein